MIRSMLRRTAAGVVPFKLYIGGIGASVTTASDLALKLNTAKGSTATAFPYDSSNITTFSIDGNNNIYAELTEPYWVTINSFSTDNDITYFIDLNGGCIGINQFSFQGAGTTSKLKMFYSQTALIRGTTNTSRNFRNRTANFKLIYAPFDAQIGETQLNNQAYDLLTTAIKIFANVGSETNNAGGVEGDIQNAITQKSAVVTYVTDTVSIPNAVSDLSTASITATSVVLNFTAPSSVNAILQYEVWVNGAFWDWITASGGSVTGLTSATNYNIQIKTADIFYNISELSNNVNFTTL